MYFTTVLTLAAYVASTSATLVARQIPSCANSCIINANLDGCQPTDTKCICSNPVVVNSTATCIEAACSGSDLQTALSFSQQLCAAVGVTLTASSTAAAPTSTAPASTTATASGSSAPATSSKAAATTHGATTFAGLAAVGLVALAL